MTHTRKPRPAPDQLLSQQLTLTPIGVIKTEMIEKFDAPHQPSGTKQQRNIIQLLPDHSFEHALEDLSGFDYIWIIYWFHLNDSWKPRVLPPRGEKRRRGVFSTRSPHRPNPIGLTAAPLIGVEGLRITIGEVDLVDGTPILDIKPYLHRVDSFPNARSGWVDEVEKQLSRPPEFLVQLSPLAETQRAWLAEKWQIDFMTRAKEILERDPTPHRTRRISRYRPGFRICCGAWRAYFELNEHIVQIVSLGVGYPEKNLRNPSFLHIPHREAQIAFIDQWGHYGADISDG